MCAAAIGFDWCNSPDQNSMCSTLEKALFTHRSHSIVQFSGMKEVLQGEPVSSSMLRPSRESSSAMRDLEPTLANHSQGERNKPFYQLLIIDDMKVNIEISEILPLRRICSAKPEKWSRQCPSYGVSLLWFSLLFPTRWVRRPSNKTKRSIACYSLKCHEQNPRMVIVLCISWCVGWIGRDATHSKD